jgi:uncharacterized protein (TIGR02996 family)
MSNATLFPKATADEAARTALAGRLTGLPPEEAEWLAGMWLSALDRDHRTAADALRALFGLSEREWSLLSALAEAPADYDLFAVAADWLQENGRDAAGNALRKLVPSKDGMIVITTPVPFNAPEHVLIAAAAATEEAAGLLTRFGCQYIVLPKGYAVQDVDPEWMRKLGWVRAEEAEAGVAAAYESGYESGRIAAGGQPFAGPPRDDL